MCGWSSVWVVDGSLVESVGWAVSWPVGWPMARVNWWAAKIEKVGVGRCMGG